MKISQKKLLSHIDNTHVRQPHFAGGPPRGRGDACVRQRPDARLRREHTGHACLRRGEGQGGVN